MMSIIPIESGVCVSPADLYDCGGSSVGMNGTGDSSAGISDGDGERPATEGMGLLLVAGAFGAQSFPEDDEDSGKGSDYSRVCIGEPNVGIGEGSCVEKRIAMPNAGSFGGAKVMTNSEGLVDCGGVLAMENVYGVPLASPQESNVNEACCSLGTTSRPCEVIDDGLHESVSYSGNHFGNDCPSALCDVSKDQIDSDCQISVVQRHAKNQSYCSRTPEETCLEKTEPFQPHGTPKPSSYNENTITNEGSHEFRRLALVESECGGSTICSRQNLPGSQICTSEIIEEFSVDEAEISQANATSFAGYPKKSSYPVDAEGVKNGGQELVDLKTCDESLDVSADGHVEQQLHTSEMTKNPCEEEEYLGMNFFRDTAHCQEYSVVLETGYEESSKKIAMEKEFEDFAPVCDKLVTVKSLCGDVVNTSHHGEGSIVVDVDALDGLPRETKIGLEEHSPTESGSEKRLCYSTITDSEKTLCYPAVTPETYQGRTMLQHDMSSYDADYCREIGILGPVEEAVDSNKLPYEEKKISTLSVGYSPETASYDPVEGSGSPQSRLSMSHQTDTDGLIASTCGSNILLPLPPLSSDNTSCVQNKKSSKSKRAKSALSSKIVPTRKSARLTKTTNVAEKRRQLCSSKLVPDIRHVLFSKMAKGKRSGLRKPRGLSCWGALENLELFKQNGEPLYSDTGLALEKGADSGVLKISKRSTSNGRRRTKARANAKGQKARKSSLTMVVENFSATGKNIHREESLPNEVCSNSLKEFGGSAITDLEQGADRVLKISKRSTSNGPRRTKARANAKGQKARKSSLTMLVENFSATGKNIDGEEPLPNEACSNSLKEFGGSAVTDLEPEPAEHVLSCKAGEEKLGSSDIFACCLSINRADDCGGEDTESAAQITASEKNSQDSSETCMDEVQTKHSEASFCTSQADRPCNGGMRLAVSFSVATGKNSEAQSVPSDIRTASKICEGASSVDLEKTSLSVQESIVHVDAPDVVSTSSKGGVLEGTLLPLHTYSKKRKREPKAKGRLSNSGETTEAERVLESQLKQKVCKKQSRRKPNKADNRECLKNIPGERKIRARRKNQAEASTDDRVSEKASIFCDVTEKGVDGSFLGGMNKDSVMSCAVPSKSELSEECAAEAFQTLEKLKPKKILKEKKAGSKKCRPNSSSPARCTKVKNREKGNDATKISSKSSVTKACLMKTFDKEKATNVATMETGSKKPSSDAAIECDDRFHGKASPSGLHLCVGDTVFVDTKIRSVALHNDLRLNKSSHESGGSSLPPRQAWVLCDDCHKWRSIPAELADSIGDTDCSWTCKDNADKRFADCSIPQEKSNAEINAELNISDASCDEDFSSTRPHASSHESPQLAVPQQETWTLIKHNIFLHRNHKHQNIDEIMVCQCKSPQDGGQGCGDGCLNRLLNIECEHGTCPCGELCSNQQFQKHNYANFEWVRCGKKGYGLQLREDVLKGQFLIEYVGEVLDAQTYAARQREYAARGQRHFYFMTLNGNEVIDACAKGNLGRFINHSCDPNCRTEKRFLIYDFCSVESLRGKNGILIQQIFFEGRMIYCRHGGALTHCELTCKRKQGKAS